MAPKKRKSASKVIMADVMFEHPAHGACCVLGEWTFDVEGIKRKVAYTYFHVKSAKVPDSVLRDSDLWDDEEGEPVNGIKREPSNGIRQLIIKPIPKLSEEFDGTAALRMASFNKHPMLEDGEVESWATSEFAKSFKAKDKEAYREAKGKVADLKTDVGDHPDVAKVLMRSLVNTMGIMSDSVRAKLGPTRPRTASPGESRFAGKSIEITLCENQASYFDTLLGMCGFAENKETGVWTPVAADAVKRLMGAHAHVTGVNVLRRLWTFPPSAVRSFVAETGDAAPSSELGDPHDAPDSTIYRVARAELGDAAFDKEKKILPAWLLRNLIENAWIERGDVRVRAHAEVLLPSVTVVVLGQKVTGPNRSRPFLGACAQIRFEWQGWARRNSPGDALGPLSDAHVARAMAPL